MRNFLDINTHVPYICVKGQNFEEGKRKNMMKQGYRPEKNSRKRKSGGSRGLSWPLLVWIVFIIVVSFAVSADAGLLILLAGLLFLGLLWALKKDREIAKRKKAKRSSSASQQLERETPASVNTSSGYGIEYVGPQSGERVPVKVAGVTFANGRRQRQTILREIYWRDKNYSGSVSVTLRPVEYEGKRAIEVWANEEQIGYIPKSQTDYFIENWNRLIECKDLKVYGGGKKETGEEISFGASFVAIFD